MTTTLSIDVHAQPPSAVQIFEHRRRLFRERLSVQVFQQLRVPVLNGCLALLVEGLDLLARPDPRAPWRDCPSHLVQRHAQAFSMDVVARRYWERVRAMRRPLVWAEWEALRRHLNEASTSRFNAALRSPTATRR